MRTLVECLADVMREYELVLEKHPDFPSDVIHQAAVMDEESGETIQAALQFVYEGGSIEKVRKEAAQTGAMAMRVLMNLPEEEDLKCRRRD